MPADRRIRVGGRYTPYGSSIRVAPMLTRRGTQVGAARKGWKRRRNATMRVPRTKLAFPQGMRTKLRYVQQLQYDVDDANIIVNKAWRANSMTDPGITSGTNHQPRGFDDFLDIYNSYTVLGSSIAVTFVYKGYDGPSTLDSDTDTYLIKATKTEANSANAPNLAPVVCGIRKGMTSAGNVTSANIMEQERSVWAFMTPQEGACTVRARMRTSEFYGKHALVGAEGYTGTKIADAENQIVYDVWVGRANNATQGKVRVVAYLMIEYDVQFNEPKSLQQS